MDAAPTDYGIRPHGGATSRATWEWVRGQISGAVLTELGVTVAFAEPAAMRPDEVSSPGEEASEGSESHGKNSR